MSQTMPILNETECNILLSALRSRDDRGCETTKGIRNHLIALLMLDAGLRVGEVVALRVQQLFLIGEPVGGIAVVTEKKNVPTTRTIPVTVRLNNAIAEYAEREWTPTHYMPNWYAFRSKESGRSLTPRQVERFLRKAALESLRRRVHPHVLRHTFATRLMAKCSIRVVQQLLGHSSISSTQVYTHPNSQDLQTAIDTLNGPCAQNGGKPVTKPVTSG